MPINVTLDLMLARRKMSLNELSERVGVTPSNLLPCKNGLEQSGNTWRFWYQGDDCRLAYTYTPASGTLDDFSVQVDDSRPFQPARSSDTASSSASPMRRALSRWPQPVSAMIASALS